MTSQRIARPILILAALAMAASARAALWVSPGGDDGSPGTEEQPLRTIERARDVVRTLSHEMTDDITVFIAGEHHLNRPLELGPEDSGTNGFNIIYTAAPGEHPVVSGGTRIVGWTLADPTRNLWSAPAPAGLGDARELFVNGTPVSRTRGRLLAVFSKAPEGVPVAAPGPQAHWRNPGDVVFEAPEQAAIWSERAGAQPSFVVNAFELLGTPGEWYLDRVAHRFYYTPRKGEEMEAADVEAAVAPGLVAGIGTKERPIAGLIFKGIRFEYATGARGQPKVVPPAAVRFTNAGGIQFLEDEFLHMGTPAVGLGPEVESCTVDGCSFADISWSAISVWAASRIRVEESRFSYVATAHPSDGVIEVAQSEDVSIEHNQIDHFPSVAILRADKAAAATLGASNLVSPPMIRFHGSSRDEGAQPPSGESGVPPAYSAILGEEFSVPTTPRPPADVSAEAEDEFAYVTWNPSCVDGGSTVTSYTVTSSMGAKASVSPDDFQARGYMVFGGLENGNAVTFTVSAVNALGASPPALPTAAVTPAHKRKLRAPQAPAAVSLAAGKAGLSVRITPPASDGGSPVTAYTVSAGPAGSQVVIEGLDVIHADATYPVLRVLDGLSLGGAPEISVAARNAAGAGKPVIVRVQ